MKEYTLRLDRVRERERERERKKQWGDNPMLLREPSGLCHSVKGHNRGLSGAIRKRRQRLMILSLSFSSIYCCILLLLLLLTSFLYTTFLRFQETSTPPCYTSLSPSTQPINSGQCDPETTARAHEEYKTNKKQR